MTSTPCGSCCNAQDNSVILEAQLQQNNSINSNKSSEQVKIESLQKKVEMVCRIALAIFAVIINFKVFAISAGIGVIIGIAYVVYKKVKNEEDAVGQARPSCAQGFFDYLTGIQCPPLVSTIITAVFIAGHMHHSPFYIGFCGVPVGIWVGTQIKHIIPQNTRPMANEFRLT